MQRRHQWNFCFHTPEECLLILSVMEFMPHKKLWGLAQASHCLLGCTIMVLSTFIPNHQGKILLWDVSHSEVCWCGFEYLLWVHIPDFLSIWRPPSKQNMQWLLLIIASDHLPGSWAVQLGRAVVSEWASAAAPAQWHFWLAVIPSSSSSFPWMCSH